MSITKILTEEKTSAEDKLARISEIVAAARSAYGNEEAAIPVPKVNTPHGSMKFEHLEDASKVAILRDEVARIKAHAVECVEQNPGTNINKKIEELLATNEFFVNVSSGTKFEYI